MDISQNAADSLVADSVAADSLAADSLAADSLAADSAAADSAAAGRAPADAMAADSVAVDSAAADRPAGERVADERVARDSLRARRPAADTAAARVPGAVPRDTAGAEPGAPVADTARVRRGRLRPEPPDTFGIVPGGGVRLEAGDTARRPGPRTDEPRITEAQVRQQLDSLPGYVATQYTGETAIFWADSNQLRIGGDSRISREGSALETDSLLVYDGETGVVCGYGNPILSGETEPVRSRRVCFDIERDVGMAEGASTKFTERGTWYVRGADNRVFVLAGDSTKTLYGQRTEFTSCDLEHPHYAFQAQSLKMVEGEMMVARNVTLQFEDVPVFWLPWMVQSMKQGRRSGLLMPQFSVNEIVRANSGYSRRLSNLGFYWAVNDYVSTRGTFEWWSGNWTAVEGALSYYWRRQFLRGSLNAKHYWRQREVGPSSREFTLNTANSWEPDERTRIRVDARYASSTDFVQRNSFDPRELNRSIRSSASVNRSFDWGSLTLGADRQQQLSTEQTDWTLPSLQLSLSPITLYSNEEGLSVTWRGSGNATRRTRDVQESLQAGVRDSETLNSSLSHSLSVGRFSLGQSVDYSRETLGARSAIDAGTNPLVSAASDRLGTPLATPPGLPLFEETSERVGWSTSLGFQQNLWVGTTLRPSVSVSGTQVRNDETRRWIDSLGVGSPDDFVAQPVRVSAGASLTTAIYGFWPGFARFSRIRHKIAPTLQWTYSPKPNTTALQDSVFGARGLRERNELRLSFSQTFEAKVESDDTAAADTAELGQPGEPRRLPQAEKITLLALNTSTPLVYDFVAAREERRGFQTDRITNSIRSDLVQGLQISMSHDLFEEGEAPEGGGTAPRTFSPFLTNLQASFSINSRFWLFQFLGLSSGEGGPEEPAEDTVAVDQEQDRFGAEAGAEGRGGNMGAVMAGEEDPVGPGTRRGGGSGWQASLSYSLDRRRPRAGFDDPGSQLVRGNISFDPTEHWSVRWTTAYSFTDGEFADHILTLTRDLHRWQANFDFLKARNGNFAFQFRVELRDNRDLKLDYDQRQRGAVEAPRLQ